MERDDTCEYDDYKYSYRIAYGNGGVYDSYESVEKAGFA